MRSRLPSRRALKYKHMVFDFLISDEWKSWTVVLSRKYAEDPYAYAETDMELKVITINPYKNTIEEVLKTLIHEILHIVAFSSTSEKTEKMLKVLEQEIFHACSPHELTYLFQRSLARAVWDE